MRSDRFLSRLGVTMLLSLAAGFAVVGCGDEDPDTGDEGDGPAQTTGDGQGQTVNAGEFAPGQGQAKNANVVAYPAGPFGYDEGSTIPNFRFYGFPNAKLSQAELKPLRLADFYNPTGNEVHGPESPLAGQPKPKALLIIVSASWCPPCKQEAKSILPGKYGEYKPRKGEFLLELSDGTTPGKSATMKDLQNWTSTYKIDYPATIDPTDKLGPIFVADAIPQNMIVDTTKMKIVEVIAGSPDDKFWATYESLLDP